MKAARIRRRRPASATSISTSTFTCASAGEANASLEGGQSEACPPFRNMLDDRWWARCRFAPPYGLRTDLHCEHDDPICTNTIAVLAQIENAFRATPRRTAVEIATCPRQCADALRSNFCRHTKRMVKPQANVLTSAQTSLADGSSGRVRARFHNDTSPCRCDRFRYRARRGLYECSTLGDNK